MIDKQKIKIASRYSKALIALSKEKNILDLMTKDILNIKEIISNPEIIEFLENKNIEKEEKKKTFNDILNGNINEYLMNFLNILIDENRIDILETIIYCYEEELDEINNIEKVSVISAIELNQETKEKIVKTLEKKLNKKIEMNTEIDEKIISGLIIKIKDKVLDLSLKNKFDNLLKEII